MMKPTYNCLKLFIQVPRHLGETDETVLLLTGDEAPLEPQHLGEIDKNIILLVNKQALVESRHSESLSRLFKTCQDFLDQKQRGGRTLISGSLISSVHTTNGNPVYKVLCLSSLNDVTVPAAPKSPLRYKKKKVKKKEMYMSKNNSRPGFSKLG